MSDEATPRKDWVKLLDTVLKFAVLPLIGVLVNMNSSMTDLNTNLTVLVNSYQEFKEDGVTAIVKDIVSPLEHRLTVLERDVKHLEQK